MWGGMLGNKRQDRGQGARNFGGNFWGKCKKRGGKTFLGECWGSCEPQQILGARNFGGTFEGNAKKGVLGGSVGGAVNPNKF